MDSEIKVIAAPLEKKIKVQEIDETPAFGLEPVYKLKIGGIVECQ